MSTCNPAVYPDSWSEADISVLSVLGAVYLATAFAFFVAAVVNTASVFPTYRRIKRFLTDYPAVTPRSILSPRARGDQTHLLDALDVYLDASDFKEIAAQQALAVAGIEKMISST